MNIVYVEDNFANIALVERIAMMGDHTIFNYSSGEEALAALPDQPVELLFVDIHLDGEMDGIEFIETIRGQGITTPVVVITAYDTELQKQRCLAAGCDDYFSKPIKVSLLKHVIDRYTP